MVSISAQVYRGKLIESEHKAICLVRNFINKDILSTNNNNHYIFPRSAIKIFQALPFIVSRAHIKFNLNEKEIAISCSSHSGESKHIHVLNNWLNKIGIHINQLRCGIHNPLNIKSSNRLLISGKFPSQLHNNCSGKHLAMISGCLAHKIKIDNYINLNHPYQKLIRDSLEHFMQTKIIKKNIGTDGCGAPQYAFSLSNIANSMIQLINEKNNNDFYSSSINTILSTIKKFPLLIAGKNCFDSEIIKITKGRIFCKGGAEGVLLFADLQNKVGGIIKILDGNHRAIPPITMKIFSKLKILKNYEKIQLNTWTNQKLYNHANKEIGKIKAKLLEK